MKLFNKTHIDFIGKRKVCYAISLTLMLISIVATVVKGPRMSIEFTGGVLVQMKFGELPAIGDIRTALTEDGWKGFMVQSQPANHSVIIRIQESETNQEDLSVRLVQSLRKRFEGNVHPLPERVEFIGPVIGKKLALDALKAIVGSLCVIVLYVAFRFRNWIWGAVGVFALAHDVLITFGLLVILQREITLVVIAALLTLAGYSINDTIVIFDRIRENMRTSRKETLKELYNRSLNETLSRTVNTSLMALMASTALFFGGDVLQDFALTMSFGVIIGSYSTIAVAIGLIHQWETRKRSPR